jgi:hypothetical protein
MAPPPFEPSDSAGDGSGLNLEVRLPVKFPESQPRRISSHEEGGQGIVARTVTRTAFVTQDPERPEAQEVEYIFAVAAPDPIERRQLGKALPLGSVRTPGFDEIKHSLVVLVLDGLGIERAGYIAEIGTGRVRHSRQSLGRCHLSRKKAVYSFVCHGQTVNPY